MDEEKQSDNDSKIELNVQTIDASITTDEIFNKTNEVFILRKNI